MGIFLNLQFRTGAACAPLLAVKNSRTAQKPSAMSGNPGPSATSRMKIMRNFMRLPGYDRELDIGSRSPQTV